MHSIWANQKSKQLQVICLERRKTHVSKSWLVLVFHLIGWESGMSFFIQSENTVEQNQSKHNITFDTQLKIALIQEN